MNIKGEPGFDAPFDRPFHVILNLAVGGEWPERENNVGYFATDFPKQMIVDYVRVYECRGDQSTGEACQPEAEAKK